MLIVSLASSKLPAISLLPVCPAHFTSYPVHVWVCRVCGGPLKHFLPLPGPSPALDPPPFWPLPLLLSLQDEHKVSITELLDRYGSNMEDGLTEAQAAEALQRDGPNVLTPPRQMPEIVKFLLQMFGGFSALLWLGAVLCFFSYGVEKGTKGSGVSDDNVSWPS